MPWLWVVFTITAAGCQVLRNAMQSELTSTLGTVGAPFSWKPAALGIGSGALFAVAAIGYRGGVRALECPNLVVAATATMVLGLVIQTAALSAYLILADRPALMAIMRA